MSISLQNIHQQFNEALKSNLYIGIKENKITKTNKKEIPLSQIYAIASAQIRTHATNLENINHLQLLLCDGEKFYARYCSHTNTWKRWFLKKLEHYSPAIFKFILPCIFANGIEAAEKQTQQAHKKYHNELNNRISILKTLPHPPPDPSQIPLSSSRPTTGSPTQVTPSSPNSISPNSSSMLPQTSIPFHTNTSPNNELETEHLPQETTRTPRSEINESRKKTKKLAHDAKVKGEKCLDIDQSQKSIERIKTYLSKLSLETKESLESLKDANHSQFMQSLKKICKDFVRLTFFKELKPYKNSFITETGLSLEVFELILKLKTLFFQGSTIDLTGTVLADDWKASTEFLKFGLQKLGNIQNFVFTDSSDRKIPERQVFQKSQHIKFDNKQLNYFKQFLETHADYTPLSLEIRCEFECFTFDTFKDLLMLKERISSISLTDLEILDFNKMNLSEEQEKYVIENLSQFSLPHLKSLTLKLHKKASIEAKYFSQLLQLCPTLDVMRQCLFASQQPKDIDIPCTILSQSYVDLSGYPLELVHHLLPQFIYLEQLTLDQNDFTTLDLEKLYSEGLLNSLHTLVLHNGKLSTDALFFLTKLNSLKILSLPPLSLGSYSLSQLPTFTDPQAIIRFYANQPLTRPHAMALYTGLPLAATTFQIVLAQGGESHVFAPNHLILDPESVVLWLQDNHYMHLQPQASVQSIIADNVGELNDSNLVSFVEKFPNVKELSLRNCPSLTGTGIRALITECPQIEKIDLCGCLGINIQFLENSHYLIANSQLIIDISDTGISADDVWIYTQFLSKNLVFEKLSLKIRDEDLKNKTLEQILNENQPLHHLNRIDLEGCTTLTDKDLSQLLARLNVDQKQLDEYHCLVDNPQRLNISILNLKGCTQITEKAFDNEILAGSKIEPKILNSLNQIVIGKTKLENCSLLRTIYPKVIFQTEFTSITIQVDPSQPNINTENFTLLFQNDDQAEGISFQTSKNLLTTQSSYFRKVLRGENEGTTLIHQCATVEAVTVLIDLFKCRSFKEDLDWKVAGQVAELVRPECLDFPALYFHKLINHIHSQFSLDNATDMFFLAEKLNDEKGKKLFEEKLIAIAKQCEETKLSILSQLAQTYSLQKLEKFLNQQTLSLIETADLGLDLDLDLAIQLSREDI
ncbi:hypothetical protein [Candidatus Protochlamydia amoebophila]|uniref:BTB domain-containing protein n=1 Tax=Candidatus Protochlamydia amoebophila TaxID=362787 RepID=A0A0C1JZY7_9BACT|nr:hypothetical protein [Candidatus Protochlamydia amoebophila]KIC72837.1 hypothetical protein DB44_BZ00150 [Candidatus Protochlamydia amoebophila]